MKNKGFTLIELLAVIVILGLIALITTPKILNMVEEAKLETFRVSVYGAIDGYELYEAQLKFNNTEDKINIKDLPINTNLEGEITKEEDSTVRVLSASNGNYCASGIKFDLSIIKGTCEKLYENMLETKINANFSADKVLVTVDVIKGIPTSYSYKIEGPDNYKQEVNNQTTNTNTFDKLKPNTEYSITVTVKNKVGLIKEKTIKGKTVSEETLLPSSISLLLDATTNKVKITYPEITEGQQRVYKWEDDTTFTPVDSKNIDVTAKIGNLIAAILDSNGNTITSNTISINNIEIEGVALAPQLGKLTPVVYKDDNWVVADTTKEWYNYENKEWANAVLLKPGASKNVGDTVLVEGDNIEVEAMFVWIPRYEYKISGCCGIKSDGTLATSNSYNGLYEINFIPTSKVYEKVNINGYRIHPAFWWDENSNGIRENGEELAGIWMGKFETTGTLDEPSILPSESSISIGDTNISNFFESAKKIKIQGYDSHMSKNSEWGAAAYMSRSIYGKGISVSTAGNFTGYGTSYSDKSYKEKNGIYTSTTGNVTGIYDMSGGKAEYVMGVVNKNISESGFAELPASKYYDSYVDNRSIYGHALEEYLGSSDSRSYYPPGKLHCYNGTEYYYATWYIRGGIYDNSYFKSNIFSYSTGDGSKKVKKEFGDSGTTTSQCPFESIGNYISFRIVLTPISK